MLLYFSATLFVSATLLFLVQPMIGKMILPQLGGTPGVWNTCMVFFQAVLLVGYGYTHILTTTQPTRRQVLIHGAVMLLPFLLFRLPFSLGDWEPPTEANPVFALMLKLTIMVGLPFMAVSTTAPLLQKWFVHTDDPAAKDPYFLYGASNFGSLIGLAAYPLILEPWLKVSPGEGESTIATQVHLWTFGYAIFVAMVVGCAYIVWQALAKKGDGLIEPAAPTTAAPTAEPMPAPAQATAITSAAPRRRGVKLEVPVAETKSPAPEIIPSDIPNDDITLWRRLRWIGLAAVPSSLMLGVTTELTTDIAAIAFFWIIPLALYLLTFILVFSRWPWIWTGTPHTVVMFLQPCALLFLVLFIIGKLSPSSWATATAFALHLSSFFFMTLMCHGELAKDRPSTKHLTEFYFWMSLGGVLGGLFNALFAPVAFQYGLWEYPIAMAFGCMLRTNLVDTPQTLIPGDSTAEKTTWFGVVLDLVIPIIMGVATYGAIHFSAVILVRLARQVELARRGEPIEPAFPITPWVLIVLLAISAVIALFSYYSLYADRTKLFDKALFKELFATRNPPLFAIYAIVAGVIAFAFWRDLQYDVGRFLGRSYMLAIMVVLVLALSLRPVRFGLSIAALFIAFVVAERIDNPYAYEARGFFGPLKVRDDRQVVEFIEKGDVQRTEYRLYRTLIHGGINHGKQIVRVLDGKAVEAYWKEHRSIDWDNLPIDESLTRRRRREPITYFHERNGVAEIYHKLCWPDEQPPTDADDGKLDLTGRADVRMMAAMIGFGGGMDGTLAMIGNTQSEPPYAVLGLGTGLLAAYAKPYQICDFYEIDPLVKDMSVPHGYVPPWHPKRGEMGKIADPTFYFLYDAQERYANLSVKLGDGRLVLKNEPKRENYYHIISLDAFSSDAIPVHLLTEEAVQLYLTKLADGGVLIFNTTNRYVRIEPVLAAIAKKLDLECLYCPDYTSNKAHHDHPDRFSADWVALRRKTPDGFRSGGRPLAERLLAERKFRTWNGKAYADFDYVKREESETETRWRTVEPLAGPVWTDGYSNLLKIMRWR